MNNWYLFLVTTDENINELEEFLVTVQEEDTRNYESQLVYSLHKIIYKKPQLHLP